MFEKGGLFGNQKIEAYSVSHHTNLTFQGLICVAPKRPKLMETKLARNTQANNNCYVACPC